MRYVADPLGVFMTASDWQRTQPLALRPKRTGLIT
jgi:hypothetical protein